MIEDYGFQESELRQTEERFFKEKKEFETKEAANELQQYLDFADIEDFSKLPPGVFQEINFACHRN